MKISKGLKQAYDLQEFTFSAVVAFQESLSQDGKLKVSRADATAIGNLVRAWETCQERVRIHRGRPLPGSVRHESTAKGKRKQDPQPQAPSVVELVESGRAPTESTRLRPERQT